MNQNQNFASKVFFPLYYIYTYFFYFQHDGIFIVFQFFLYCKSVLDSLMSNELMSNIFNEIFRLINCRWHKVGLTDAFIIVLSRTFGREIFHFFKFFGSNGWVWLFWCPITRINRLIQENEPKSKFHLEILFPLYYMGFQCTKSYIWEGNFSFFQIFRFKRLSLVILVPNN